MQSVFILFFNTIYQLILAYRLKYARIVVCFSILNTSRGEKWQDDCSWCIGTKSSERTQIAAVSLLFSFFLFFPAWGLRKEEGNKNSVKTILSFIHLSNGEIDN